MGSDAQIERLASEKTNRGNETMSNQESKNSADSGQSDSNALLGNSIPGVTQLRCVWKINGVTGNGMWFADSYRDSLNRTVAELCAKYGHGTYWVEENGPLNELTPNVELSGAAVAAPLE